MGFALVALLMCVVYWLPGLCATIALCIYILIVAIVINAFDVTLTLYGS